ncbi:ATP-dependent DNA ligase [Streptomyces sp. NPDC093516]|uniref:ATP-dependent DNA ligase n=1 Tax=Streptomyces sp. NPDC093516 TaxID=3155304 RepID=UPI003446D5BD
MSHETQQSLERDGYRTLLSVDAGQVVLRSRRGAETGPAFPEIMAGVVQPPQATAFDGELVVWERGRLAFERLQNRLQRRGAGAARAAAEAPAHFVAFDLLRLSGTDTTVWPYRRRRAALESVFAARRPSAPWALCPSTADPNVVREWPTRSAVGMEGVVVKGQTQSYPPGRRGWSKVRARTSSEAVIAAVTGPVSLPSTLLLGRYDQAGRLRYVARTAPLSQTTPAEVGGRLAPAAPGPPVAGAPLQCRVGSTQCPRPHSGRAVLGG